jgi:dTDP-4-dehydrorhamnose reductase
MRILLFGKYGQLGWELHRSLSPIGAITAIDYPEIDLSKPEDISEIIETQKPDLVINAAAYTDVDKAEKDKTLAYEINAVAPGIIARACQDNHAAFIHYSTDYVFDGAKEAPYTEVDTPNPINYYGESKLAGEVAVNQVGGAYLILRTSWVYSLRKGGFVNKVLEWSRHQKIIKIVDDQVGSPTWARLLAEITTMVVAAYRDDISAHIQEYAGIYHIAGNGSTSRYEWAKAIIEMDPNQADRLVERVEPVKSSEFPTPAMRPKYTSLDCTKFYNTFRLTLPQWKEGLRLAMCSDERMK